MNKPDLTPLALLFDGAVPAPLQGPSLHVAPRETPPVTLLAAWPGTEAELVAIIATAGIVLPRVAGSSLRSGDAVAHCQSPGCWLVEHPGTLLPQIEAGIGTATDLSEGRSSFIIEGADAVDLAQKLAPVDFAAAHDPMCFVQCGSDHGIALALWRETEIRFIAYVERSYGHDFWHVLEAESAEFRA